MPESKIVCVSANAAMDRRLRMASLAVGAINRAESAHGYAGGKAAHVVMASRALASNAACVWIGFLGGSIGQECAFQLEYLGIQVVSIPTAASTRVNLEIIEGSGRITEILEPGGEPTAEEKAVFLRACAHEVQEGPRNTLLVISGSLPAGVEPRFYLALVESARAAGVRVFVDISGEALREIAKVSPDFVKTNRAEAETLVARPLKTIPEVVHAAREIIQNGAGSAAITLGREGLVWVERKDGPMWVARPPRLKVISTVGCGDATLAGFACAAVQGMVGAQAMRFAAACGAANCLASAPGRIERVTVESLLPQIEVQQLAF